MRFIAIVLLAIVISYSARAAETRPFYAATFGITIDADGGLKAFRLVEVTDPLSGTVIPVKVQPPQKYVDAARQIVLQKKYTPVLEGGKPKEFFTWFFYVPSQPDRADLDPTEPVK
ncbi:hypothetical protein [Methylomonas koyamae]|uniref:hypothetical protein n=1 Tax=Methylomonas koyamae TaxID=702114 RepID=UPI000A9AE6CD|nr:hypothetical protein [Methylomonas koyamae]BBL56796.1 hypothetical protein MKFW12EY_04090 [Methylomonas koyamae]